MTYRSCKGFTLVEVMVALGIFGIVMAALPVAFIAHQRRDSFAEDKTRAIAAAQKVLDEYRQKDPSAIPRSGRTSVVNVTVDGKTFGAITEFCTNPSFCANSNNRHLRVTVSRGGRMFYRVETVYTRLR